MFKREKKSIEKQFQFLIDKGFDVKKYFRPPDEEYIFTKGDLIIEVSYYLGIQDDGNHEMCFSIAISLNGDRRNIIESDNIFDRNSLKALSKDINNATLQQQRSLYSEFLKNNIY